jgi:hypothetical protein
VLPSAYAPASGFRDRGTALRTTRPEWLATALLALVFVALLAEHVVRRESARTVAS